MKNVLLFCLLFLTINIYGQSYNKGDKVQIEWKGKWYSGKIEEVKGDKYLISYDGYDASWNETVGKERLRSASSTNVTSTTTTTPVTNASNTTGQTQWSYKSVESIWDMVLSPDGKYILAASAYGKLYILDAATLEEISMIKLTEGSPVFTASWSHDGNYIATGYNDGNAIVYMRTDGMQFSVYDTLEGYASIADVRFNPKKPELLVSGSPKKDYTLSKVDVWDIANKKIKVKIIDVDKWGTSPTSITYSDDGTKIAIAYAYDRKGIEVYDSTGKIIHKIKHTVEVDCLDFSPDGSMIVSGGIDCSITLWNLSTNKSVWTTKWHESKEGYVNGVAFAPDGLTIAACGRGSGPNVRTYDFASGKLKNEFGTKNPVGNAVCYSSDSKYIYVSLTTYGDIAKVPVITKYLIP